MEHNFTEAIVLNALADIAKRKVTSIERIERLLFVRKKNAIIRQFWKQIDKKIPGHPYQYVGRCPECGSFELREELPPSGREIG